MKLTLIIASMLLSDWAAAARPVRRYPCSRISCEMVAKNAGVPFAVKHKSNGAPAGCVQYNDGGITWVRECVNHPNCNSNRCNGCKVISDDKCKAQLRVLAFGCGDNSTKQGNWCKCYPGFKMNINPKTKKPYGGWDSQYHFNVRNDENAYCVPDEEYLNSYLTSKCADENESCSCSGMILYGQEGSWGEFFKSGYALRPYFNSGAVQCSSGEFGELKTSKRDRCMCVRDKRCDDNAEKQGNWCQCKQGFQTKRNEHGKPYGGWPTRYHFNAVGKAGFVCEKPLAGLHGECWDPSKTVAQRDAMCAGDLVCARRGYDKRDFGGCAKVNGRNGRNLPVAPFNRHCCSKPPAGLHGECWDPSKTVAERDEMCEGDLVCARAGYDSRHYGGCTKVDGSNLPVAPFNRHCCSQPPIAKVGCEERTMQNVDVVSGKFKRVEGVAQPARAASDEECAVLCRNTSGCQYFVRQPSSGYCWRGTGLGLAGDEADIADWEAGKDRNLGFVCPFAFTLRGETGEEVVGYMGENYNLDKEKPIVFKSAFPDNYVVFNHDDQTGTGKGKNVLFASRRRANISMVGPSGASFWRTWKCGSSDENERCGLVRKGAFNWDGVYYIAFQEAGTRRIEQEAASRRIEYEALARRLLGSEEYINGL